MAIRSVCRLMDIFLVLLDPGLMCGGRNTDFTRHRAKLQPTYYPEVGWFANAAYRPCSKRKSLIDLTVDLQTSPEAPTQTLEGTTTCHDPM